MTPLTPLLRAFRSELLKCRRWSMFAGTGIMLVASRVLILVLAHAQGVQTAAWTSVSGLFTWLAFFGNEVLCLLGVCLLGMLIAVLTRSTGIAVGVALAYVLVPEGIIAMVWNEG